MDSQTQLTVDTFSQKFKQLTEQISRVILGQEQLIEDLLIAVIAKGHVLIEGAPGLGKTRLVRALSETSQLSFGRIQFTPDLMPADVTGTMVFMENNTGSKFEFQKGPIFHNVVLADEINRATPKTQSALLEAMQEQIVTASGSEYALPNPFMVLATQNPLEMEGTYPLPEAQLDRFLFKLLIKRPDSETLARILVTTTGSGQTILEPIFTQAQLLALQQMLRAVPIASQAIDYVVRLIEATHGHPQVRLGSSPRGAQAITLAAKGYALAAGRAHVELEDIRRAVFPALRHRLLLSFEAEVEGVNADNILAEIMKKVDRA